MPLRNVRLSGPATQASRAAQVTNRVTALERARVKATYEIKVFDDATTVTTGNGKFIFAIPSDLNGWSLVTAEAFVTTVSSSGLPTVAIRNVTTTFTMTSTNITIDASEFTSYTAATASVINATYKSVSTSDLIAVDVTVAGTGAKGLGVILAFGY